MNPLGWLGRRPGSFPGEEDEACREGRRAPSWPGCGHGACESVRLSDLDAGAGGVVTCLEEPAHPWSRKLAGLGLLPGAPVEVLQRRPVYVVRLDHAEFALDHELASRVRVRVREP